jgi:hypothetical protein
MVRVMIVMEKPVPEFAIFQNSRTRQSALWVRGVGKWRKCSESDYDAILTMANMLRKSQDAGLILEQIAQAIINLEE